MSAASTPVADPAVAGVAVPGGRLLGLLARMTRTGRAIARSINRIAQQKLLGHDVRRLAPAGFDATLTNAFVVQAVAWTAALRDRLLALAGRQVVPLAPDLPGRATRACGTGGHLTEVTYEVSADDRHDWPELAKAWRTGPGAVAVAAEMIAGKPDREVVAQICDYLQRAAAQLGAEADVARIAALAAAARALCPDADADSGTDSGGRGADAAARAGGAWAGGAPGRVLAGVAGEPPPELPDG